MDAETPAGRLVTALRERGIKSEASDDTDGVIVNGLFVDAVDCGWGISGNGDDLDGNIEAAANAIAAIVQAPGLRAESAALAAEVKRLREELEKPVAGPWRRELFGSHVRWHASAGEGDRVAAIARPPGDWRGGWTMRGFWGAPETGGPETDDAGRHAADLALLAAGYRLVGGVHPLPVAAECKHKWKNTPFSATGPDSDDGRDGPICSICGEEWEVPDAR